MIFLIITARFLLAAVFAVAGFAKLADRKGARASVRAFGVPEPLADAAGIALPIAELSVAGALLLSGSARWGAAGALALLALFVIAIAANMALGRAPDCHCFGQLHSEPAGWRTLARNAVLICVAAVVLWGQAVDGASPIVPSIGESFRTSGTLTITLLVVVIAQAVVGLLVVYQLLKQNGRMLHRLDAIEAKLGIAETAEKPQGLPRGTPAPVFSAETLDGATISSQSLERPGQMLVLLFLETRCGACDAILPEVAQWQRAHAGVISIVPIFAGDAAAVREKIGTLALDHVLIQTARQVSQAYLAESSPNAVLIKDGRVAWELAVGPDAIRDLVTEATQPPPLGVGDVVPAMELRRLEGGTFDLSTLRGRRALILFWSPSCGFCQAMLDEIKAWEAARGAGDPDLIVISRGSPKANREQGFRSPVMLDSKFAAGRRFAADGTPAAVLIDEEGRVAAKVGVGRDEVLALAGAIPAAAEP